MIFDLKQAADFLQCNPEVLRRNLNVWGVPHFRLGKRYCFLQDALERFVSGPSSTTPEQVLIAKQYEEMLWPVDLEEIARLYPTCSPNMREFMQRHATPKWVTSADLRPFYELAAQLTAERGEQYHVDHIIPLQGESVCGLNVPSNLRVITASENLKKHNKFIEELL